MSKGVVRPWAVSVWGLLALTPGVQAADVASRIHSVTVYPGVAVVERVARVPAGAKEVVLGCLSTQFDMAALRVEATPGIRVGAVSALSLPRDEATACQNGPLEARITALEERIQALQNEQASHELVLNVLKSLGQAEGAKPALSGPLGPTLAQVQRSGLEAGQQQQRLQREREKLELELKPLKAQRARQQPPGDVRQLTVQVAAGQEGELRLSYQVPGATWAPAYRATLDLAAAQVDVERMAQVSQRSGEDWVGVSMRLSTGSPHAATQGPLPRPWQISPRPPVVAERASAYGMPSPAPAPVAPKAAPLSNFGRVADAEADMSFAVQVSQSEFATEFAVPGKVDVASGKQRVSFSLETARWPATVLVQAVPVQEASAWLLAEVARPAGVWPDGPMSLMRGTQAVGQSVWRMGNAERLSLPFGRDELVSVRSLPPDERTSTTGFISSRQVRREARHYEVESRRKTPIALRVIEAFPVSTDEQITVQTKFEPAVDTQLWQSQPGMAQWQTTLKPGEVQRFKAEYLISLPKDLQVQERR